MNLDAAPLDVAYTAHDPAFAGWGLAYAPQAQHMGRKGLRRVTKQAENGDNGAGQALARPDFTAQMQRVKRADRAAFAGIFHHYGPRVKAFLMKSGSDAALAEELAQDVMATVWQKAAQFDPARASLATWIFTIARNRRIDYFRRARRPEPEVLDWGPDSEPDQAEVYQTAEDARLLTAALAALPEAQRAMIERAYYGDLSHSEIAAQTGLPLGTIKSRIRLALERLRQTLDT